MEFKTLFLILAFILLVLLLGTFAPAKKYPQFHETLSTLKTIFPRQWKLDKKKEKEKEQKQLEEKPKEE
ncbi:MAG: hypothetical protein AB7P01_13745 [Bacteroidia bacterium]